MPVYNGESTIEKTLVGLLVQSKKFDELIVIDDGSKDRSVERLKNFLDGRMDYNLIQNEKRLGLAAGYNRGIKSAKGDLIVTLHQDIILD
ncbi:MAG: Glycosyl transferase family 2 [Candidatus Moranbacteria bacterium GW2011_GWF2_44_10]|nr:MAG: Glycosyl transferase family 2 [Candidatus Moranbacteria bacterium GW2011_GWF2_44_10]